MLHSPYCRTLHAPCPQSMCLHPCLNQNSFSSLRVPHKGPFLSSLFSLTRRIFEFRQFFFLSAQPIGMGTNPLAQNG